MSAPAPLVYQIGSALMHAKHDENPDAPFPMVRPGCAFILAESLVESDAWRDALADAWDAGAEAGRNDEAAGGWDPPTNPYRTETADAAF